MNSDEDEAESEGPDNNDTQESICEAEQELGPESAMAEQGETPTRLISSEKADESKNEEEEEEEKVEETERDAGREEDEPKAETSKGASKAETSKGASKAETSEGKVYRQRRRQALERRLQARFQTRLN